MSVFYILILWLCCGALCDTYVERKLKEAFCKARLFENYSKCNENPSDCGKENLEVRYRSNLNNETKPELLCRGENLLGFWWESKFNSSFLVEVQEKGEEWKFLGITTCKRIAAKNLKPKTQYKIRIWEVTSEGEVYKPIESDFKLTSSINHMPQPVRNLTLINLTLTGENYEATIMWEPSSDESCFYDFVWFGGDELADYKQKEIKEIRELFQIKIGNLDFSSNYSVAVMAKSTDWNRESEKKWLNFLTPSCLEAFGNLDVCSPEKPQALKVNEILIEEKDEFLYDLKVTWKKPNLNPSYYTVSLMVFSPNATKTVLNVTGTSSSVTFKKVPLGLHYQITVQAWSPAGPSEAALIYRHVTGPRTLIISNTKYWTTTNLTLVIGGCAVFILAIIIIVTLVYYQCAKRKREKMRTKYFKELEEKTKYLDPVIVNSETSDKWDLNSNDLSLGMTLGQGAFGLVKKGWLKMENGSHKEVAVKMLQESPTIEERRQFTQEIEIMKSVGSHKHLVSLIGCCLRRSDSTPLLVVEFCSKGDLKSYLQSAWENIVNQTFEVHYSDLQSDENIEPKEFSNKTYDIQFETAIQAKDLLSIARQIAIGMEYLSSLRVLHRDLAARNVLVCEDKTVKISDFGLSRDVYKDNIYYKLGSGKLPIRWMALESLTHQVYTTQSDVWSYGILLWEIVTLGGNPYPGISTQDLPKVLENGYRMECPANCGIELYTLMLNCWKKSPKERPTFTEIKDSLEKLLEKVSDYLHFDLTSCRDMKDSRCPKITIGKIIPSERYVNPVTVCR